MSSTKQIEMAHVVQALESVRGAPVLTSNQCHDLAMALRPILGQPSEQRQGEPVAMPDRKP